MKTRIALVQRERKLLMQARQLQSAIGRKREDEQQLQTQVQDLTSEVETLNAIVESLQEGVAELVTERDSARMMYCEYDNSVYTKEQFAEAQGWEYLYAIPEP